MRVWNAFKRNLKDTPLLALMIVIIIVVLIAIAIFYCFVVPLLLLARVVIYVVIGIFKVVEKLAHAVGEDGRVDIDKMAERCLRCLFNKKVASRYGTEVDPDAWVTEEEVKDRIKRALTAERNSLENEVTLRDMEVAETEETDGRKR